MLSVHLDSDIKRSDQILAYVCKEQEDVFNPVARLFPMNFPAKQDASLDLVDEEVMRLHFLEEIDALNNYLDDT